MHVHVHEDVYVYVAGTKHGGDGSNFFSDFRSVGGEGSESSNRPRSPRTPSIRRSLLALLASSPPPHSKRAFGRPRSARRREALVFTAERRRGWESEEGAAAT